jgi:hypothetical protein
MKYKKELKEALKDVDFMEAVHEAKRESTLLLEEQGILSHYCCQRLSSRLTHSASIPSNEYFSQKVLK